MLRVLLAIALAIASLNVLPALARDENPLARSLELDIPAQPLPAALIELSRQGGVQVLMPGRALDGYRTAGLRGTMTLGAALEALLPAGRFRFREAGESTIAIDVRVAAPPHGEGVR